MYKVNLIKDRPPRKKGDSICTDKEGYDNLIKGGFAVDESKKTTTKTTTKKEETKEEDKE